MAAQTFGSAELKKVVGGLLHLAYVDVATEPGETIEISHAATEPPMQWQSAAEAGARFALVTCGATARITICRLAGTATDTTPTAMAVASARSVWNSLCFDPPEELVVEMEAELMNAWDLGSEVSPYFNVDTRTKG